MEDHHYCESNNTYCTDNEVSNENENNISIEEKESDAFLIELYRERPFLYNKGHKDFKNIIIKDNVWKEISKIIQNENYGHLYTPDYCQTRCTSLRNQYNREKRIIDSQYKSGSGASTHKPFAFYTQLSFLDNYIKRRSNIKANKASTSTSSLKLSTEIPQSSSNEVFDTKEKSSHSMHETEDNNFNGENNKENILEDTLEAHVTHKRNIDKDSQSDVLLTKPKSKKVKSMKQRN